MVLIICLILFIWGIYGFASDYDHEAERRHREKLDAIRKSSSSRGTVRRTRTIVKDEKGRIIAQEVEVEFIPDMDDEDASKEPCLPVEPE